MKFDSYKNKFITFFLKINQSVQFEGRSCHLVTFFPYLVQDVVVILLSYTHELTIVYFGSHNTLVVQLLHCWRDTKTGK